MTHVTHRCTSKHGTRDLACTGYRTNDGETHHTCGEPCAWVMGKTGHGEPPFGGPQELTPRSSSMEFDPGMDDISNVELYCLRHNITGLKISEA